MCFERFIEETLLEVVLNRQEVVLLCDVQVQVVEKVEQER